MVFVRFMLQKDIPGFLAFAFAFLEWAYSTQKDNWCLVYICDIMISMPSLHCVCFLHNCLVNWLVGWLVGWLLVSFGFPSCCYDHKLYTCLLSLLTAFLFFSP